MLFVHSWIWEHYWWLWWRRLDGKLFYIEFYVYSIVEWIAQRGQLAFIESLTLSGVILLQTEGGHCHADKYSNMTERQPSKMLLLVPIFME